MDAFVVRVTPSLASQIVPNTCVLSYDDNRTGFTTRWVPSASSLSASVVYTIQWRIRGRVGKAVPLHMAAHTSVKPMLDACTAISTTPAAAPNRVHQQNGAHLAPFVSYLKSHLQKTVRQQQHALAVATAKALLERDVLQCVRRIAIIMVEDVDLFPRAFGVLTWWTAVLSSWSAQRRTRGLSEVLLPEDVPCALCEWLLGLVHALCSYPVHRQFPYDSATVDTYPTPWAHLKTLHKLCAPSPRTPPQRAPRILTTSHLSTHLVQRVFGEYCRPEWMPRGVCRATDVLRTKACVHVRDAVQSVMVRATYGGLHGDIRLLHSVATAYVRDLLRVHASPHVFTSLPPIRSIDYDSVRRLYVSDWNIDAIDFHVAPYMLTDVVAPLVHDDDVDLRRMVWENMSSVNTREARTSRYAENVWVVVHPHVIRWQTNVLHNRYARLGRRWV